MDYLAELTYWVSPEGQEKKRRKKAKSSRNLDMPIEIMQKVKSTENFIIYLDCRKSFSTRIHFMCR